MKNIFLFILLFCGLIVNAQIDTLPKNEKALKNAGKILKNSFLSIPKDYVYMGEEVSNDWGKSGLYTLGAIGLVLTDKITTRFLQEQIEPNIKYSLPNISFANNKPAFQGFLGNDAYITYPIIGLYLGSLVGNNKKGQYVALNAFKSLSSSMIISQLALKTIFGRNRPIRPLNTTAKDISPWTKDNLDFFNARDKFFMPNAKASSFPSLHATAYFAVAKVFQMEYDNYWIPYGFMSIVFLADLESHNHWVSDMVVGGLVGTIIGRSIVKNSWKIRYGSTEYKKKEKNVSFTLLPKYTSEMPVSIYLAISFNGK